MSNNNTEQEVEQEDKPINLALRLNADQYARLKKAAAKAEKPVSTWMKEVCFACAGDTRTLEELLKSVAYHLEE